MDFYKLIPICFQKSSTEEEILLRMDRIKKKFDDFSDDAKKENQTVTDAEITKAFLLFHLALQEYSEHISAFADDFYQTNKIRR
jgi:hypothetical protein